MEVILNINDLNYLDIFKNITLTVEKNKITTISGSNNSGKTTLCRILDRKITGNFNINLKGKDIKDYSLEEYNKEIQVIYPKEITYCENSLIKELEYRNIEKNKIDYLKKEYKKFLEKKIEKYTVKEIILSQILIAVARSNELIIIDGIDYYLTKKELDEIYEVIKNCMNKYKQTFIITSTSLEHSLQADKLCIIQEGEIILHGEPLTILQNDNILNKAGLNVPFMVDLSVKLRDYELIKNVELDKERLIDAIWN